MMLARTQRTLRTFAITLGVLSGVLTGLVASAAITAPAAGAASGTSRFVPLPPQRLLDTRVDGTRAPLGDNGIVTLPVLGQKGVKANAVAVVLNVTSTGATAAGFVTAYPAGIATPTASNLNIGGASQDVANLVTVPVGANGSVSFYTAHTSHLVVDVFGYYEPSGATDSGRFAAVSPIRVFDSRDTGILAARATVRVGFRGAVPANATAAVLNVTMVDSGGGGYLTVFAAGAAQPTTSNVNTTAPGQTVANQVIVPVTAAGIDVFSYPGGHLLVDVAGYFTGAGAPSSDQGLFIPVTPTRFLDTRSVDNPIGAHLRPSPGFTVERSYTKNSSVPANVSAIVMNTTLDNSRGAGFVTTYAAGSGPLPNVSTLNVGGSGKTVANHTITTVTTRGVAFYTSGGGHLIADISGYFTGSPRAAVTSPVANPEAVTPELPGQLTIPAMGLNDYVYEGIDIDTVNRGPGHWPGTAGPGSLGNMTIFGHRVSNTRPFNNLDVLNPGDDIFVTAEGVTYRYVVIGTDITTPDNLAILNPQSAERTLTLIACHPPTSIRYRIVTKARFVEITSGVVEGI
jgi:LPXTG-site transpeptidase (sortase) family protein